MRRENRCIADDAVNGIAHTNQAKAQRRGVGACWLYLSAALAVSMLFGGCRQRSPAEPDSVSNTVTRGPFEFTATVTPASVWVGDAITLALRAEAPDGYVVRFINLDDLGELAVRRVGEPETRVGVEGGVVWRQVVTAEPLSSGAIEVPPLVMQYAEQPVEDAGDPIFEHELVTQPLEIEVLSALTAQDTVTKPRDITGTLTPPRQPRSAWFWLGMTSAAIAGLFVVGFAVYWLRRLLARPAPPLLPEVWALRALARLEGAGLIDKGEAKRFYYRLSEIVRVYVERKFGLAAPEMTTEEFLVALARDDAAVPYDAGRLRAFLEACDLVKYAAFTPRVEDANHALGMARVFIDATAAAEAQRSESTRVGDCSGGGRGGHAA